MRLAAVIVALLCAVARGQSPIAPVIAFDSTNRTYSDGDWMDRMAYTSCVFWATFQTRPTNSATVAMGDSSRFFAPMVQETVTNQPDWNRSGDNGYCWFQPGGDHYQLSRIPSNVVAGCAWVYLTNAMASETQIIVMDGSLLSPLANKGIHFILHNAPSLGRTNAMVIGLGSATGRALRIINNCARTGWNHYAFAKLADGAIRLYTNGAEAYGYTNANFADSGAFQPSVLQHRIGYCLNTGVVNHAAAIDDLMLFSSTNIGCSNMYMWTKGRHQ